MRYRPFGRSGAAVSAVSLALTDTPMRADHRIRLVYSALESGINIFDVQGRDPALAKAVGEALSAVERQMVFVSLRLGWGPERSGGHVRDLSPEGITGVIDAFLSRTPLGRLDVAILDLQEGETLPANVIPALQAAKAAGRVTMLGISGGAIADAYIGTGEFDVLVTPFNLQSGWVERNRLRRAGDADMDIIGCNFHPVSLGGTDHEAKGSGGPLGLGRLLGGGKGHVPESYDFLEWTVGWTPEQICLGFALTEPSLASVQIVAGTPEEVEALASVVERELPTGVAAQIEMARFSSDQEQAALAKRGAGA